MDTQTFERLHKSLSNSAGLNKRSDVQHELMAIFNCEDCWRTRSFEGLSTKTFTHFLAYVEYDSPWGLNWTKQIMQGFLLPECKDFWEKIEAQIPASNQHGGDRFGEKSNITCNVGIQGNSRSYSIAALKRDAPDIAEKVIKGEISAAKGMVMAGKKSPTVTCKVSVQGFYDAIHRKLDPHEIDLLKAML